jgi:hypothetical protein
MMARRRGLCAARALVPAWVVMVAASCFAPASAMIVSQPPKTDREAVRFICAAGRSFTASLQADRARIVTRTASYDLRKVRSSIGVRFVSRDVAFAYDGGAGFLIGAAGGPYKKCAGGSLRRS